MAFTLSRIDRLTRTVPGHVDVALLPPRSAPTAATVWLSGAFADGVTSFLFAGPDADPTGAVVVPANAQLWKREVDSPEVDAEKVERITVLGGGAALAAPTGVPVVSVNGKLGSAVVLSASDVGAPTTADLTSGLATKVNSSTYTAGLAAKQDVATLGATVAADATVKAAFTRPQDGAITTPRPRRPMNVSLITGMQPGHGFTNFGGTAATVTDDTTDFLLGSQSLKVTTKTDNTAGSVQKTGMSVDTTGRVMRIALKVTDMTNITELLFYASNDTGFTNYHQWTLIDPDSVQSGPTAQQWMKSGEWVWMTLAWNEVAKVGAPTRTGITAMRLRTRSTNGTTVTVNWNGVALVAEDTTTYPNGVVSFSYDDSYDSTYTEARKALDTYGWTGTAYTICDLVGTAGFMTVTQLKALQRSGWEVAAHSYTMADHQTGFHAMTAAQLHTNFREMRRWLTDNSLFGGDHMAWPQGAYTPAALEVARQYFASARTINRRTGETLRPADALRMRSTSVSNTDLVATITAKIDAAKAEKSWLVLTFHHLLTTPTLGNHYSIANHQAIVDYCNTVGIAVRPVGEVLRAAS